MRPVIVQVVPRGGGGLSDFAQVLSAHWRLKGGASVIIELSADDVTSLSLARRLQTLGGGRAVALLLHFSGYGYGERGLCGWLVRELQAARHAMSDRLRIVIAFHELFARDEPPWRSAFWLGPLQAGIARRLAAMADALWTNAEQHAHWLSGVARPGCPVRSRPVFSNVGEPDTVASVARRSARAVLFGAASTRRRAAAALCRRPDVAARLGIDALVEVGPGAAALGSETGLRSRYLGRLPAPQLSRLLADSRVGVVEYPGALLAKSGVFAAYAAHGCAVLNVCRRVEAADGLRPQAHYLTLQTPDPALLPSCADAAWAWYRPHASERQAEDLKTLCLGA